MGTQEQDSQALTTGYLSGNVLAYVRESAASAARLKRALERIAVIIAAFEAHQITAERAAYEAGLLACKALQGPGRRWR